MRLTSWVLKNDDVFRALLMACNRSKYCFCKRENQFLVYKLEITGNIAEGLMSLSQSFDRYNAHPVLVQFCPKTMSQNWK